MVMDELRECDVLTSGDGWLGEGNGVLGETNVGPCWTAEGKGRGYGDLVDP
jgi:hypothetical protein